MTNLLEATAALVAIPSVSGQEGALADHFEAALRRARWLGVDRVGDNVVARTNLGRPSRLVLAGHLDTVPPEGNDSPHLEGDRLWGRGSTDMKGGLAVMTDIAVHVDEPAHDLTFVYYACEEIERERNGLLALAATRPDLMEGATAAIVCEPTSARVEAGCQGVLKAQVTVTGESAHVARPWTGDNAVHRLGPVIGALAGWGGRRPEVEGVAYRESLQAVGVSGGGPWNVLPSSAVLRLNYRFAPDLDVASATEALAAFLAPVLDEHTRFEVLDSAPSAPPALGHPVLAELVAASGGAVVGKLGWTDAAFFAERGVPAANFGPGDPELAHKADESVTLESLEQARLVLGRLVGG